MAFDEEPVRRERATEAHRLLVRFTRSRAQLASFHQVDKPAFGRWVAAAFREHLDEVETLHRRLVKARHLAERVELEREENRSSYHEAYRSVLEDETAGLRDDVDAADQDDDPAADLPPEDPEGETREFDAENFDWTFEFLKRDVPPISREISPAELAKDRYRKIVRILHPDLRSDRDALADELWHQTQEAFRAQDGERLEALLSIARLRFGDGRERPFIGEVIAAARWLRAALASIAAEIRLAKRDDAWGFSTLADRTRLYRKIAYQIDDDMDELRADIARYEAFLQKCATPATRRKAAPRSSARR